MCAKEIFERIDTYYPFGKQDMDGQKELPVTCIKPSESKVGVILN